MKFQATLVALMFALPSMGHGLGCLDPQDWTTCPGHEYEQVNPQSELERNARKELKDFALFYQGWLAGKLTKTQANYRLNDGIMTPDFIFATSTGAALNYQSAMAGLFEAYGSDPQLVEILDISIRTISETNEKIVLRYLELHKYRASTKILITTASFVRKHSAPNRIQWQWVQETESTLPLDQLTQIIK